MVITFSRQMLAFVIVLHAIYPPFFARKSLKVYRRAFRATVISSLEPGALCIRLHVACLVAQLLARHLRVTFFTIGFRQSAPLAIRAYFHSTLVVDFAFIV